MNQFSLLNNIQIILISSTFLFFGCVATTRGGGMSFKPIELNDIEKEFLSEKFEIVYDRDQIKKSVLAMVSGGYKPIANPGEKYNESDMFDLNYPSRKLIFAGSSEKMLFVHYAQGGFSPHHVLLLVARFFSDSVLKSKG